MSRLWLAGIVCTVLPLSACGSSNVASDQERRQVTSSMIQSRLCFNLLDQVKAKFDKLDTYDKDALGSYGYNWVLYLDLCTDSPAKTTAPDDASGGDDG